MLKRLNICAKCAILSLISATILLFSGCTEAFTSCTDSNPLLDFGPVRDFVCQEEPIDAVGNVQITQGEDASNQIILEWDNPVQLDLHAIEVRWTMLFDIAAEPLTITSVEGAIPTAETPNGVIRISTALPIERMRQSFTVEPGFAYRFRIASIDSDDNLSPAQQVQYITAPIDVRAELKTGTTPHVLLTWRPIHGATEYYIYRAIDDGRNFTRLASAEHITGTSYEDYSVVPGITYTYRIRAIISDEDGTSITEGESSESVWVLTQGAPAIPQNLVAEGKNNAVELSWASSVGGADSYRIYRVEGADISRATRLSTIPAIITNTTYTDSTAVNGTQYTYVVRAVNANDAESADSEAVTATPLAPPNPPVALTATVGDEQVVLSWNTPTDGGAVLAYYIYRVVGADISSAVRMPTIPAVITNTTYTDSDLTNGTEYTYAIRAVNANGAESANSNIVTVTPVAPDTTPPTFDTPTFANPTTSGGTVTIPNISEAGMLFWALYRDDAAAPTDAAALRTVASSTPSGNVVAVSGSNTAVSSGTYTIPLTALDDGISYDFYAVVRDAADNLSVLSTKLDFTTLDIVKDISTLRDPANDFNTLAAGNRYPTGAWSDDTTMWVADFRGGRLYAYNLSTKAQQPAKDFNTLAAGNRYPQGIWSDGITMWVADYVDDTIYAYNLSTRTRDAAKDFNGLRAASNRDPQGIWSDGTTMWVADYGDDKLYAYNLSTKARDAANDFNALGIAGNGDPQGIWSDGTTMWVADTGDERVYAYNLSTKARDAANDFDTLGAAGNGDPYGIWSDGNTMWVTDYTDDKMYAYHAHSATASDFAYYCSHGTPVTSTTPNYYHIKCQSCDSGYALSNGSCVVDDTPDTHAHSTARDPANDFDTLVAAGNDGPTGIWSDDTTMWVADWADKKIYAYNLSTKARDAAKDFNTLIAAGHDSPTAIWSDGITMWVADSGDKKIYAYNLSTKAQQPAEGFDTLRAAGNDSPSGIWSDGTTMWVADYTDGKVYAYNLSTKARDAAKDFDTLRAAGNRHPQGLWSDGTTMWVTDNEDDTMYAYNLSTKARDAAKDFKIHRTAYIGNPQGIWSDGTTMWVADWGDRRVYAYHAHSATASNFAYYCPHGTPVTSTTPNYYHIKCQSCDSGYMLSNGSCIVDETPSTHAHSKERDAANDFDTLRTAGNEGPTGIWSDGTTMWVADWADKKIYAYNLSTKVRDAAKDFSTLVAAGHDSPTAIWSDGITMWVADSGDKKIYAYSLSSKAQQPAKDFDTLRAAGNDSPSGIWSDGITMWVADYTDGKVYAYNLSTKAQQPAKEFNTLRAAGNRHPQGLWSDGTTMWVTDNEDDTMYAYNLSTKARDAAKDFKIHRTAYIGNPQGIWSDGTTMWVADWGDRKVYAYHR